MKIIEEKTHPCWISVTGPCTVLLWLIWLQWPRPKETLCGNNARFLPLLNSGFRWDNGAMRWQQRGEGRDWGLQHGTEGMWGRKRERKKRIQDGRKIQSPDFYCLTNRSCLWHKDWSLQGAQELLSLWGRLFETRDGLTHPIQTAQVLHHVLICVRVIVDHSVLLVHTARLRDKSKANVIRVGTVSQFIYLRIGQKNYWLLFGFV